MRISVVGLGKLGLPLVAVLASKGHIVIGADTDERHVAALNRGECPINETGLSDLLRTIDRPPYYTNDVRNAVEITDATFIVVPTPSLPSGAFSLEHVLSAGESIGQALKGKNSYHLVVLVSTVMPGSTKVLQTVLECMSGRYCGSSFGLCYNPEFIALGSVIHDLLNPDMVLIGESDWQAGAMLQGLYDQVCNMPVVIRTTFVNAEIAKLAINTYLTTKISYANMIAELCERIPGADSAEVLTAMGHDSRIGHKYLKGALGYGGPCLPRDNQALMAVAEEAGMRLPLAGATKEVNRRQVKRIADMVPSQSKVGVLGLTYKPGTSVMDQSQGVGLAQELMQRGFQVSVYDPTTTMWPRASCASSAQECIGQSDTVIIATPWPEFADISAEGRKVKLIDCWRILRPKRVGEFEYVAVGRGPDATERG